MVLATAPRRPTPESYPGKRTLPTALDPHPGGSKMAKSARTARKPAPKRPRATSGARTRKAAKSPPKRTESAARRPPAKQWRTPAVLRAQAKQVVLGLAKAYPHATCALTHQNAYQLIVA